MKKLLATLLCAFTLLSANLSAAEYTLKFATLAPSRLDLDESSGRLGQDRQRTQPGATGIQILSGGVQGDEPDVLKKMRSVPCTRRLHRLRQSVRLYSPARCWKYRSCSITMRDRFRYARSSCPSSKPAFRKTAIACSVGWKWASSISSRSTPSTPSMT